MPELVLHHYEMSPFSEKMRRILAFKRLPWRAVRVPAVLPKPDVIALTGGYRKTPVLQLGNHIYCDTSLMARVLEGLAPEPTLYPTPLAQTFAEWADSVLFEVTVPIALRPTRVDDIVRWLTHDEMVAFGPDRKAMGEDARRKAPPSKISLSHLPIYLGRIDATLARTRFVLGDVASIADFSVYHCAWFVRSLAPQAMEPFANILTWLQRMAAFEGPEPTQLSSSDAIELCRNSSPDWQPTEFADPLGLSQGQPVIVRALDYGRDPVQGALVGSSREELVVERQDERASRVFVHFPRIGYEVVAVK